MIREKESVWTQANIFDSADGIMDSTAISCNELMDGPKISDIINYNKTY